MCCTTDWPLAITDASKSVKSDVFKKQLEEAALIIKSTYWYVHIQVCVFVWPKILITKVVDFV